MKKAVVQTSEHEVTKDRKDFGLDRANRFKGVTTVSTLGNASPKRTARGVINTYCSCLNKSHNL